MIQQPPANTDIEAAILAAATIDNQALMQILEATSHDDFYLPDHRQIRRSFDDLRRENKPVDILHVRSKLSGEPAELTFLNLLEATPTSAGIKAHCETVVELANRRRAIIALHQALEDLHDKDSKDPIALAQSKLLTLSRAKLNDAADIADLVDTSFGRAWEAHQRHQNGEVVQAAWVETGINPLDELLTIKQGDMVIIGARPSAGKTSIGLQIAMHVATERPVLFFSLEEPAQQIADRYLTTITGVGMRRMREGRTTPEELDRLADAQASAQYCRLVVNDTPGLRVSDMRNIATRLQASRGEPWGAIMIDHMIKVRGEDQRATGHVKLTQVSQDIKNFARTLRIPIIVLTQLRRPQNEDSEPTMTDLRESGSIEEDADSILLIHRPERDKSYSMAKMLLQKQRTGPCGSFELMFDAEKMRFRQLKGFGAL